MKNKELNNLFKKSSISGRFNTLELFNEAVTKKISFSIDDLIDKLNKDYKTGIFYTPKKVAKLFSELGKIFKPKKVLIPNCDFGSLLRVFNFSEKAYGLEINKEAYKLARYLNRNANIKFGDFIHIKIQQKFDMIAFIPPFGVRVEYEGHRYYSEVLYIKKSLNLLDKNGILICLVPNNFLTAQIYETIRKNIIHNYSLELIINLPTKILPNSFIQTSIIVIKNCKPERNKVLMAVYDDNIKKIINNYLEGKGKLWINRQKIKNRLDRKYFDPKFDVIEKKLKGKEVKKLKDIAEIIKGYSFRSVELKVKGQYLILSGRNIKNGKIILTNRDKYCNLIKNQRFRNRVLQEGDIYISLIFRDPKIYIYKKNDIPAIINQNGAIIRSRNNKYIAEYLKTLEGKEVFEKQIDRKRVGRVIPHLTINALKQIRIPIIPIENLNSVVDSEIPVSERYETVLNNTIIPTLIKKGWDVLREYRVDNIRLDIALLRKSKLISFIEVKSKIRDFKLIKSQLDYYREICNVKTCFLVSGNNIFQYMDDNFILIKDFPVPSEIKISKISKFKEIKKVQEITEFYQTLPQEILVERRIEHVIEDKELYRKFVLGLLTRLKAGQERIEGKLDKVIETLKAIQMDFGLTKREERDNEEKLLILYNKLDRKLDIIKKEISEEISIYIELSKKLIENWDKLDDLSKEVIPLAEYLYSKIQEIPDVDFSPVILQYCKALENELLKKLFIDFTISINKKYKNIEKFISKDLSNVQKSTNKFASYILKYREKPRNKIKYTLGEMQFILNLNRSKKIVEESPLLQEFIKFIGIKFNQAKILSKEFIKEIEKITKQFRNKCAHPYKLGIESARACKERVPKDLDYFLNSKKA